MTTTYIFIHGAWGGGWVWSRLADRLRAQSQQVFTPTLTGLGERSHLLRPDLNLNDHIQDIANMVHFEQLSAVTLVGHSYGGIVATGVAQKIPDRIENLVYLDAFIPESGQGQFDLQPSTRELFTALAEKYNGHYAEPADPTLLGVTNPVDADWISERSTPHPLRVLEQPLPSTDNSLKRSPNKSTYIRCTGTDLFVPQATTAARRGWRVHEFNSGHFPQVTHPDELADLLQKITKGNPYDD